MSEPGASVWIVRVSMILVAALFAVGTVGCAAEESTSSDTPVNAEIARGLDTKIFGGKQDDGANGASAVVALKVGTAGDYELCSGALIAPNVVLTARHCVAKSLTGSVACDENGRSANGKHVTRNRDVGEVTVYTGASPRFSEEPRAVATHIVSSDRDTLCDDDIALVVLDTAIDDIAPLAVRVGAPAPVVEGETVTSVGYGKNDQEMPLGTRLRKDGVPVLAMGKGVSESKTALGRNEFEVGQSICEGDSGGPALSEETGAVIGVVSRGGDCNDDHGHIYTATSAFADLFDRTFALAGGAPTIEAGQPEGTQTAARPLRLQKTDLDVSAPSETEAGGCSAGGRGARASCASSAAILLGLALVLRRRRPSR